jgi:hypothetical protein
LVKIIIYVYIIYFNITVLLLFYSLI